MAHKLADEVLTMILSPPLLVPDALFADTGPISPFSRATHSSSDVLLVCKRWMRFATPALYHTLILRSAPQAKALAAALKRNPAFGAHVRRLRLEGAYGANVSNIVKAAPNIVDFCFTLALYADANVKGLVDALRLLNPERVILTLWRELKNKKCDSVLDALCKNIARWTRLTSFTFAYGNFIKPDYLSLAEIPMSLAVSPSIKHVTMWWSVGCSIALQQLLNNPRVDVTMFREDYLEDLDFLDKTALYNSLTADQQRRLYLASPTGHVTTHADATRQNATPQPQEFFSNPLFRPLEKLNTVTHSSLWMRIIWFAIQGATSSFGWNRWFIKPAASWYDPNMLDSVTIQNISKVSPELQRLVENVCGTRAVIGDIDDLPAMVRSLCARPKRAEQVQTVRLNAEAARWYPDEAVEFLSQLQAVTSADLPLLEPIVCAISRGSFRCLRVLSLSGDENSPSWPMDFLDLFPALERLRIDSSWDDEGQEPFTATGRPVCRTTHGLQSLTLGSCPPEFLRLLAQWRLPRLHELRVKADEFDLEQDFGVLLRTHGYTLQQCVLSDQYPPDLLVHAHALEELTIEETRGYWVLGFLPFFEPVIRHASLVTLRLKIGLHDFRNFTGRKFHSGIIDEHLKSFLTTFQRDRYPALATIQMLLGDSIWPTTEREMKSNTWHLFAEEMLDRGITLLDKDGRAWRRRLR